MDVAEFLLSGIFKSLYLMVVSSELRDFTSQLLFGVDSEIDKLERTLKMIEAVFIDAEEKELKDQTVRLWLEDLKDLVYDVEDIMDEFAYEALQRKLMAKHPCISNFTPCAIAFNISMFLKIKGITSQLEKLCNQKTSLGLQSITVRTSDAAAPRPPSTSLRTESVVYGRDVDKTKILNMFLCDKPRNMDGNFDVISIVGQGGIGKTTLAREVFHHEKLDDLKFDVKAWVSVTDNFDVLRVSTALLEAINSSCHRKELNEVQKELKKALDGKKFLLVLDDVWNKNYVLWEQFKSPFMGGASGSKILVTTREEEVASMVERRKENQHKLQLLSDDDCWKLIKEHVFGKGPDADQISKSIREVAIKKCRGLPLAAMTLAGVLRTKRGDDAVWSDILNSQFWDLPLQTEVLPVLRLSYHYLPSHLKRCFAYCAIFPKGYEYDVRELVPLWMAEGLILQSSAEVQPENLGNRYFRDLLSRGFFQQSTTGSRSKFLMHDLVHDLAESVSKTTIRLEEGKHQQISNKVRHAAYGKNEFADFYKLENLRTFIPLLMHEYSRNYISSMVLVDLLPKFKKLRVLSLARSYISELPDSIGGMRHLRYLNVSYTKLESVPESISLLFKLQILILRNCHLLKVLPSNMRNLVNLRYLDIFGTFLKEMPLGMTELKDLRMLSNFVVSNVNGSNLEDLRNLKFLQGELCISKLSNILESKTPKEKIIHCHKDLKVLLLDWSDNLVDSSPYEVLDMLQPHSNLEELTIKDYRGARFPSWLGNQFSKMMVLNLENCIKCETLPCLGLLGSLEKLSIEGMRSLKYLGFGIYGDCLEPFKSLKTLYFGNLQEWETWEPNQENEDVKLFSCLRELSIVECPKLMGKLPEYLPSLETLFIRKCAELMVSFSSFPSLCNLKIDDCKGIEYSGSPLDLEKLNSMSLSKVSEMRNWLKQGFYQVKSLSIVDSEEFIYRWQNMACVQTPLQTIQSFTLLEELCIDNCTSLDMFPGSNFLPNLSFLKILNCKALKSLPDGVLHNNASVESLEIRGCDSLTFIVRGMLPLSLKRLEIRNCEKLQCLVDDKEDICTSSSSSFVSVMRNSLLENLYIFQCPSLTCISTRGQLPMSLKYLDISCCANLESITERFDYNTCLKEISLWNCENLKSIPEGLHNLSCLENINLRGCSSVVSLPKEGLPNSTVSVAFRYCEKLESLPDRMHNLHSLQTLEIRKCRNMASFPAEGLPTNLTRLDISGNLKVCESLIEWGLHKLTSLKDLRVYDCLDAVCFPLEEMRMRLPTSLIFLRIGNFPNLKYLSPTCFQGLNSLSTLSIWGCQELTSLSNVKLPSSLLELFVRECPLLKIQRKGDKGRKWSNIAHIPCVWINDNYI